MFFSWLALCLGPVIPTGLGQTQPEQWNGIHPQRVVRVPEWVENARERHSPPECVALRQGQGHHLWRQSWWWGQAEEKQRVQEHRGLPGRASDSSGEGQGPCKSVRSILRFLYAIVSFTVTPWFSVCAALSFLLSVCLSLIYHITNHDYHVLISIQSPSLFFSLEILSRLLDTVDYIAMISNWSTTMLSSWFAWLQSFDSLTPLPPPTFQLGSSTAAVVLEMIIFLMDAIQTNFQQASAVGSSSRAQQALNELHTQDKTVEMTDQLMVWWLTLTLVCALLITWHLSIYHGNS